MKLCTQWWTSRAAIRWRSARIRTRRSSSGHRERVVVGLRHRFDVVRVDLQRFAHLHGGAREFAEHEHAVFVGAARDELLGDEVHPVAQRRDEHDVRRAVQATT